MHLIQKLLCFFFLIFFFSSCSNKAIDFNNNLVNIQKKVLKEAQAFGKKMKEVKADSLPLTNAKKDANKLTTFIDIEINQAENLSAPKDGNNLKSAILDQLQFEKDIVFKIGRLTEGGISQEERTKIGMEFLNSGYKANQLEDKVRLAQEAFAKQNKFKLETK
ncbi:MAG: hypothetical protein M3Z26_10890 [Bacteroidota bacterium]|nr:hypothetical protein [Bacteroidota bacterium]